MLRSWCFDTAVEMDDARDLTTYNFEGDGLKALPEGDAKVSASERLRASLRCDISSNNSDLL